MGTDARAVRPYKCQKESLTLGEALLFFRRLARLLRMAQQRPDSIVLRVWCNDLYLLMSDGVLEA